MKTLDRHNFNSHKFNHRSLVFAICLLAMLTGCSGGHEANYSVAKPARDEAPLSRLVSDDGTDADPLHNADRKIIYTAHLNIVVENFDGIDQTLQSLTGQHEGYVHSSNLDRLRGEQRSGSWTLRIPVSRYDDFLKAINGLGVPVSQTQEADDVTEEFVDLDARIASKEKLEERIVQLLERTEDKIQHVIEVERELARVRQEIEQLKGRLRYLTDRTSMTTVHVDIREERNYQPAEAMTLSQRVSTSWENSVERFRIFCEDALVFLVGNALVMVSGLIILFFGWLVFRKAVKR